MGSNHESDKLENFEYQMFNKCFFVLLSFSLSDPLPPNFVIPPSSDLKLSFKAVQYCDQNNSSTDLNHVIADIDGLLTDVEGELSELQEMKVTLIKEKKKNLKTSKELQKLKKNSLISSSDQNTPEDSRLLSQYGRDVSTSIPDLLQELESEKRRREEAEKEAVLQREKSERLEGEHLQTKKELDDIKRHSMAFSDLSDYSSYCEGELEIDQDIYPSSNEVGEGISADMYDCDEGLWGKCRYGSIHSPPNEQVNEFETRAKVSSGQVVGTLVSKICELEDKLETEKAKQFISYSEITRLKLENEGLRRSMEDIVNTLNVEDSEFEVINAEENESESHQFIDECCQALENTAFEPDCEQSTASPSNTNEICPPAMSLQASGTWRSLNRLHYEFDDYDNVIEKRKNNATDLKDALRELRHTTSFLKSRVQREGLELRVLRTKMKYS